MERGCSEEGAAARGAVDRGRQMGCAHGPEAPDLGPQGPAQLLKFLGSVNI